jgi:hypothetical protein
MAGFYRGGTATQSLAPTRYAHAVLGGVMRGDDAGGEVGLDRVAWTVGVDLVGGGLAAVAIPSAVAAGWCGMASRVVRTTVARASGYRGSGVAR